MSKLLLSLFIGLVVSALFIQVTEARSGCCSHHSGVCGCGCCDGTSLSAICAPYYPECSALSPASTYRTPDTCTVDSLYASYMAHRSRGEEMSGLSQKTWWNKCSQIVRQRVYSKIFLPVPAPVVSNKEDEFSKKQECGKLTTQITQTLKNRDVPYNDGFAIHSSLDKVFYSVKQNSCLYTTNIYALADKKLIVSYGLYDALSNEIIKVVNLDGTKAENDQSANEFLNFAISYGY